MNNLLKSIFIATFPAFAMIIAIDSIIHMIQNDIGYRYLGRLVSSGTIAFLFASLFIYKRARTERNLNLYTIFIALGFLISFIGGSFVEGNSLLGASMSFILLVLWIAYIKWYSEFGERKSELLKVGNTLPEFTLEDGDKNKVLSSSYLGSPTIFLFYRGNWCPLCMAQIKEIARQYKELEKRGAKVVLISPQPHKFTKSLAKKYDVNFDFLVDVNNTVAKQLGILTKNGIPAGFQLFGYSSDTIMPTVVITDKKGKIIFADLTDNYRVRPEPETFLQVLGQ
ncbi:peroxiredoxin family protein [Leptobacterium sp. I13]|uniref:peroxiredoxin family protein n=1 Tax=Leptobacterium meishanense TaxID=3128904 RepID=UPI0030EDEDA2